MTMNSWKSILLSACLPPLMMFAIGTGRTGRWPRRGSGRAAGRAAAAAALAAARLTPRIALAPSLPLLGVPSAAISARSRPTWSAASRPTATLASTPLTLATALVTPFAEIPLLVAVAQLDGLVDAGAGPRGDGRPAEGAVGEDHVDLDGRVAAAVKDLAPANLGDRGDVTDSWFFYRSLNAVGPLPDRPPTRAGDRRGSRPLPGDGAGPRSPSCVIRYRRRAVKPVASELDPDGEDSPQRTQRAQRTSHRFRILMLNVHRREHAARLSPEPFAAQIPDPPAGRGTHRTRDSRIPDSNDSGLRSVPSVFSVSSVVSLPRT